MTLPSNHSLRAIVQQCGSLGPRSPRNHEDGVTGARRDSSVKSSEVGVHSQFGGKGVAFDRRSSLRIRVSAHDRPGIGAEGISEQTRRRRHPPQTGRVVPFFVPSRPPACPPVPFGGRRNYLSVFRIRCATIAWCRRRLLSLSLSRFLVRFFAAHQPSFMRRELGPVGSSGSRRCCATCKSASTTEDSS